MISRWIPAQVAVNEHNEVIGILYTGKGTNTFPIKQTPPQVTQRVREPTATFKLDHHAHAEKVRKIYQQAKNYQ